MAMETILDRLESRIGEIITAYESSTKKTTGLAERVAELEEKLEQRGEEGSAAEERIKQLEAQRDELAERLEKVLSLIDTALEQVEE